MRKPSQTRSIYLDYASITPVDKRVAVKGDFVNPSSIYGAGVAVKKALDGARTACAAFFHAHADEIVFTASGTESNNIALLGVFENLLNKGKKYNDLHLVISAIEHASVLETARALERKGVELTIIPVNDRGIIDLEVFKKSIRPATALVSVMMVNNEIGTIQPIQAITKIIRDFRKTKISSIDDSTVQYPLIHTDACQALLYLDIDLEKQGIDLLTADSHKIYGPRGVGMLYVRRSARHAIAQIMYGGGQEDGLRPGTENTAGIIGFAKALTIAAQEKVKETKRLTTLREYAFEKLIQTIPGLVINGDRAERIANNISISIPGIDHEFLLLQLDVRGIQCSTKSSCLRDEDESYVLRALRGQGTIEQALRFSLGRSTTKKDLDYLVKSIDDCIHL